MHLDDPGRDGSLNPPSRVLLVRHAGSAATQAARVPMDEPALGPQRDVSRWLGPHGGMVTSPASRCQVEGAPVEPLLRSWDLGHWGGRALAEVPDLAAWRSDPAYDGHGGESLLALLARAQTLLESLHTGAPLRLAAMTHAAVIRAVLVSVLRAPAEAFWDLDIAPRSVTEIHSSGAGWRVTRVNCQPSEKA